MYLVQFVVSRFSTKLPAGISKDDLYGIGSMGLISAARKFDDSKGVKFKTYSVPRIRGAILDELRRYTLGGQTLCRKARQIEQAMKAVELRNPGCGNVTISDEDIAEEMGISKKKLSKMMVEVSGSFLFSLDEPHYSDNTSSRLGDTIEDQKVDRPDMILQRKEQKKMIETALKTLSDQEKKVMVLYYFEELNLREIGLVLGVSESRISQIHTKAILQLRSRLNHMDYS